MSSKYYAGFESLEKLLEQADHQKPIDAMPIVDPGKAGKFGISIHTQLILVAQQRGDELLYCRIVTGRYQAFAGEVKPLSTTHDYPAISASAWAIVQEEIKARGFTLREALVALPKNLRFLDGTAECLHFNKETDRYERRIESLEVVS